MPSQIECVSQLKSLGDWLHTFAPQTHNDDPTKNTVETMLQKAALVITDLHDSCITENRYALIKDMSAKHNLDCAQMCAERRAAPGSNCPTGTHSLTNRCEDCTKRLGVTSAKKNLT